MVAEIKPILELKLKKYMFIYDPRCIVPYKLIRKKKIGKYIKFDRDVTALKINEDINYSRYQTLYLFEALYILAIALMVIGLTAFNNYLLK